MYVSHVDHPEHEDYRVSHVVEGHAVLRALLFAHGVGALLPRLLSSLLGDRGSQERYRSAESRS
jgi:hypothetical protein